MSCFCSSQITPQTARLSGIAAVCDALFMRGSGSYQPRGSLSAGAAREASDPDRGHCRGHVTSVDAETLELNFAVRKIFHHSHTTITPQSDLVFAKTA